MQKRKVISISFFVILAVLLMVGTVGGAAAASGGVHATSGLAAPQGLLSTVFTYQGHLTQNGNPVNDTCDFRFNLWDQASGGTHIAPANVIVTGVTVSNGEFSAQIDFGTWAFDGNDRFLEIEVACPTGSGSYSYLGRQPITPAPYAMSLVPDALIEGSPTTGYLVSAVANNDTAIIAESRGVDGTGLVGLASATNGLGFGVFAQTNSAGDDSAALYANATAASGITYGVNANNDSNTNFSSAIFGNANSTTGGVYGVRGQTNSTSPSAAGVWGWAANTDGSAAGVLGTTESQDPNAVGVYGAAGGSGLLPMEKTGMYAESDTGYGIFAVSTSNTGVYGVSEDGQYGIYGYAQAASGYTAGVYGKTASADGSAAGVYGEAGGANLSSLYKTGVYGESDDGYGLFAVSMNNTGIYGISEFGEAGVYGHANAQNSTNYGVFGVSYSYTGHGGHFVNLQDDDTSDQVGMWAGSVYNNVIEAHQVDASGNSTNRVFLVDTAGDVYADGSYTSPAADFAELLPAQDGLEPGDVLVIGLDGQLARSTSAYQPTVVGVYSTEPGFLGGASDTSDPEGKVPLAVVGVVPVKVSAENGAIQPGDMLVASATPGHAMRTDDAPNGTVIGKALEGLDAGTGVILMLVILQ